MSESKLENTKIRNQTKFSQVILFLRKRSWLNASRFEWILLVVCICAVSFKIYRTFYEARSIQ